MNVWNREKKIIETLPEPNNPLVRLSSKTTTGKLLLEAISSLPPVNDYLFKKDCRPDSKKRIRPFIEKYKLNPIEFDRRVEAYNSFAEFTLRKLKRDARPIDDISSHIVSPCDGNITVYPEFSKDSSIKVNNLTFDLESLLKDTITAKQFYGGSLAVIDLAPWNYHRFHYPLNCTMIWCRKIGSQTKTNSDQTIMSTIKPFVFTNRYATLLENNLAGFFCQIEIGSLFTENLLQTNNEIGSKTKGEEKGLFGHGGSTVVLIFKKNKILFDEDLTSHSSNNIPSIIRMGEKIGLIVKNRK